jgi:macrodomain Ter protein organizer (MatP/YcbG family)
MIRSFAMNERFRVLQRQPRRISITLSYHVHEALLTRSEEEGRSVSNLCAFLLEDALREQQRTMVPGSASMANGNGVNPAARVKMRGF